MFCKERFYCSVKNRFLGSKCEMLVTVISCAIGFACKDKHSAHIYDRQSMKH